MAIGGLFASVTHVLRERFDKIKSLPIPERAMLVMTFVFGALLGGTAGVFLVSPHRNVAVLVYGFLCAAATGLLFRRLLMTKFACKHLSGIVHLQDKARKELFEQYENADEGRYTFMIYCYLCHESVLMYLSMEYSQNEIDSIQQKLDFNRKDHKHYSESLASVKSRLASLKSAEQDVTSFERERLERLTAELEQIESERPPQPDFVAEVKKTCASKLDPLDAEHKELSAKISRLEREVRVLKEDCRLESENLLKLRAQKRLIAGALRQWKKTPMPIATDYKLVDKMCIDSKSKLTIVTHNRKPIVLLCKPKQPTDSPADYAASFIYRYIKGL